MATLISLQPLALTVGLPYVSTGTLSIRERIVKLIEARLQTILSANGYQSELGAIVTEGMLIDGEPPAIPSINFWDGAETTQNEAGMILRSLQVVVETYDFQAVTPTPASLTQVARHHVHDVERALWRDPATGRPDPTFHGLAVGMSLLQSQPSIGMRPQTWIGSLSTYEILYRTAAGDPYTNRDEDA